MLDFLGLVIALAAVLVATAYWYRGTYGRAQTKPSSTTENHVAEDEPSSASSPTSSRQKKSGKKKAAPRPTQKRGKPPSAHPRFLRRFGGHSGNIVAMSVSPNGEWMATAGTDGQIRVAKIEKDKSDLYLRTTVKSRDMGVFQDHVSALSWSADLRTIVCAIKHSREIAFYRIRRKKDDAATSQFPYELAELPKRRFATSSKVHDDIGTCLVDPHTNFCLVVTNCRETEHGNTVAWDGTKGEAVGALTTCGVGVRLSPDGRFLCGRGGGSSEVKVYEVHRKKVKGGVEPVFDRITPKSVMTLVSRSGKVADVAFCDCGRSEGEGQAISCDKAVVGCVDGSVQLWSLDVEYRLREDPKLLCSTNVLAGRKIVCVASSSVGDVNRIAVATSDSALHLLTYSSSARQPSISLDFSIECTHAEGVGDVQFCPISGKVLYSRGLQSKDVFAWTVEQ